MQPMHKILIKFIFFYNYIIMLLQSLEDIALRIGSLTLAVYAAEKTNIMRMVLEGAGNEAMLAAKVSAFLTASEYVGDMIAQYSLHRVAPKLYTELADLPYAFLSNAVVLYTMEKLNLDDKIITSNSDEGKAIQWALLFVIVQEISHKLLGVFLKKYF
jgi:hypothetical protein